MQVGDAASSCTLFEQSKNAFGVTEDRMTVFFYNLERLMIEFDSQAVATRVCESVKKAYVLLFSLSIQQLQS